MRRCLLNLGFVCLILATLQGCVVLAVADLAATAVVKTTELAVDGVVGTAKFVGRAVLPNDDKDKTEKAEKPKAAKD